MYNMLKKITPIMIIVAIAFIIGTIWKIRWAWEEVNLEFVSSLPIQQVKTSNNSSMYSLQSVNAALELEKIENDKSRCCVEIHTEEQWEDLVEIWEIENGDYIPEFPCYYIISMGWEIRSLRYKKIDKDAGKISYGVIEKAGSYQPNVIYIYRYDDNVALSYIDTM